MSEKKNEAEEFKLPTKEMRDVEIFEAGTWKGMNFSEQDLDEIIDNFKNGVIEPYLSLNHDSKMTEQAKVNLKVLSLGWVSDLKRVGKKLVADFKQVPPLIADLVQSGALKKRSSEIWKYKPMADGKIRRNVLQAVTFHGGDGIPALNTLSDAMTLYEGFKSVPASEDGGELVSFMFNEQEEKNMAENISLPPEKYEELVRFKAEAESMMNKLAQTESELKVFKDKAEASDAVCSNLRKENDSLLKLKSDIETREAAIIDSEAKGFIDGMIEKKKVLPKHKDFLVQQYKALKSSDKDLSSFKDEIESRSLVGAPEGEFKGATSAGSVKTSFKGEHGVAINDMNTAGIEIQKLIGEGKTFAEAFKAVTGEDMIVPVETSEVK